MLDVTNLEVCLEDMFCTSGDQLTDSYSLMYKIKKIKKGNITMIEHKKNKYVAVVAGYMDSHSHRSAPAGLWQESYPQTPEQSPDSEY